jgi:hypothetical protein
MNHPILSLFVTGCLVIGGANVARAQKSAESLASSDIATPAGLPPMGKWMIDKDGSVAHWLGELVDGKKLHEPINVILIDADSATPEQARSALIAAAKKAGYPVRFGHSTGYRGYIGGSIYSQLPQGRDDAFSNRRNQQSRPHLRTACLRRRLSIYRRVQPRERELPSRSAASLRVVQFGAR